MEICRNTIYLLKKSPFMSNLWRKGELNANEMHECYREERTVCDFLKFDLKDGPKGLKELSSGKNRRTVRGMQKFEQFFWQQIDDCSLHLSSSLLMSTPSRSHGARGIYSVDLKIENENSNFSLKEKGLHLKAVHWKCQLGTSNSVSR